MTSERRRSTRIEILGRLHGRVVSLDVPVRVREISLGGMAIETAVSFAEGAVHDFRLRLGDGTRPRNGMSRCILMSSGTLSRLSRNSRPNASPSASAQAIPIARRKSRV